MSSTVIKIESLWKEYRYGVVSQGYLFRDVQSWWAKVFPYHHERRGGIQRECIFNLKSGSHDLIFTDGLGKQA